MPHSSKANDTQPHASNGPSNQYYNHAITRFLNDPDQRRPPQSSTVRSAAAAEAADTARIAALLHAFKQQFSSGGETTNTSAN
ncbi:hypothetical protein V8C44DRAFT_362511 [Trichoderma aethiopicum]